jgi:hypothetical protein
VAHTAVLDASGIERGPVAAKATELAKSAREELIAAYDRLDEANAPEDRQSRTSSST